MAKAAVMVGQNQPLVIRTDVGVEATHADEGKVRMGAPGVGQSGLSMHNRTVVGRVLLSHGP